MPLIDIARYAHGTAEERGSVASQWDEAFRSVGVCHLSGIDEWLPPDLIRRARRAARAFFELPHEEKRRAYLDGVVGYLPLGAEDVAASAGATSAAPDRVESLNLAGFQEEGCSWHARPHNLSGCPWEGASWLPPQLASALAAYWRGATSLMLLLMSLSEQALQLPPAFFDRSFAQPASLLRIAWYPPQAEGSAEGQSLRYGEHTDFDGFTLLHREGDSADGEMGGLEIQLPDGEWLALDAPEGTLTINIGDLLQRWTNDRWKATKHRVAQPSRGVSHGRLSVVYFTGPHPNTLIECLPSPKCVSNGSPVRYTPITAHDHVLLKMRAASVGGARTLKGISGSFSQPLAVFIIATIAALAFAATRWRSS